MQSRYAVRLSEFHGHKIISRHRTLAAAIRASQRADKGHVEDGCKCCGGGCYTTLIGAPPPNAQTDGYHWALQMPDREIVQGMVS